MAAGSLRWRESLVEFGFDPWFHFGKTVENTRLILATDRLVSLGLFGLCADAADGVGATLVPGLNGVSLGFAQAICPSGGIRPDG